VSVVCWNGAARAIADYRAALELGCTALDRDNPGHATWFETFEKRLESCSPGF
jgi:hypothetical protein